MRDFIQRLGILGELFQFLWKRRLFWLIPMIVILVLFTIVIIFGGNSPLSPFVYSLF